MIVCKNENCPYYEKGTCGRRVTVINSLGICAFLYKGSELKQNINSNNLIKKEVAVFDAEISQTNSEDLVSEDAAKENEKEDGN